MHEYMNMILTFYHNMAYYMTCYTAWIYVNVYKAINEFKAIKIAPQKSIYNIIINVGLIGLGSKPSLFWTHISQ